MTTPLSMVVAQYAKSTSFGAIPLGVRDRAKQVILDEMASAYFGRRSLGGDLAMRYVTPLAGENEALILGTRLRSFAQYAAFANGAAGHGDEVDGAHVIGGHPGATLVHAAVAVAERQKSSGAELINAVVLGYDVGVRLLAACGGKFSLKERLHLYGDFLYSIGAAVACGRLLHLEPAQICHAMSLCTFQSNALASLFYERRHISKSICNGQFAYAGVSAALMSAAGLEGVDDVLGEKHGLLEAWGAAGAGDEVIRGLGSTWSIEGANFKFINAGYPIHAAVEAAMTIMSERGLGSAAVQSIDVGMPRNAMQVVSNREMHNICVQDMVCAWIVRGGLRLADKPFPEILGEPEFVRLRSRIHVGVDADLDRIQPDGRGARVTIMTLSGDRYSTLIEHPRGHSLRGGVSWSDLEAKWRGGLPGCDTDRIFSLARSLQDVEVAQVTGAFSTDHGF